MAIQSETELFAPIKRLLEAQGYTVRSEVHSCDVVGLRDDQLVVVELKRSVNLDLIIQGVERLKLTDTVYIAAESNKSLRARGRRIEGVCRRLGLGLIAVSFAGRAPRAEVICDPTPYKPRQNAKRRSRLLKEFKERSADYNIGGSNGRPLVTAYREDALRIARYLQQNGPGRPKDVRDALSCPRAWEILYQNYYGWFERAERGIYQLTPNGEAGLAAFAHVINAPQRGEV